MYIRNLEVSDLRSITKGRLEFVYPGREPGRTFADVANWPPRLPNVNLLLGINGAGKSTMLDAVALAALSPVIADSSGFRPYALIRRNARGLSPERAMAKVEVVIHPQDREDKAGSAGEGGKTVVQSIAASVERRGDFEMLRAAEAQDPIWDGMFRDHSPAFLMVGYGATRRVEPSASSDPGLRAKSRQLRYERVASLFEDHFTLRPLASWLPEWQGRNPGRYKQVVGLISRLSRGQVVFTGQLEQGEYLFQVGRRNLVPYSALSDAYKAYIGWIGDLLYHVCMGCPSGQKLVDNKGVVLVDEIDLHIHPEWQRTMIPTLAETLPNLQFIMTSHSPLVVGTLERVNVIHVETGRRGNIVIKRPDEEIYGLTADQILRSEIFGLDSTRDPKFKAHLDELTRRAVTGDREAAMKFMRQAAKGSGAAETLSGKSAEMPDWLASMTPFGSSRG
ncbi:AAA family ATPase [Zavarzinia compransoris]|uniref:ATP-binding protein n=1 Tax=Zavarzinia compransoris TaxID=1264899 RepID=A0A317ECB1_9PROT|nr:ATP-binding protein [Zavarzinia compransoris]PWR23780.1 ATP-binding protein [Zavarzinia compransoris]TDP48010.1 putative ATP-binding protein involved in virulence [Zavarzinia compransoris]